MTTIKQFTIERIEAVFVMLLMLVIIAALNEEVRMLFVFPIFLLLLGTLIQVGFKTGILVQLDDYERAIVLRRGRFHRISKSGWNIKLPWLEEMKIVDLRQKTMNLPPQQAYTADEVKVHLDTVVFYKVIDPRKVVLEVDHFTESLEEYVRSALRDIAGNLTVVELIGEIEKVNDLVKAKIEPFTSDWGINIVGVQITNVQLPQTIESAMQQLKRQKDLWAAARWQAKARQMEIESLAHAAKHLDDRALKDLYLKEAWPKLAEGEGNKVFFPVDFKSGDMSNAMSMDRMMEKEKKAEGEQANTAPPHIRQR